MKLISITEARYAQKSMSLDDFERGDRIILINKSLKGIEIRAAKVTVVNWDNNGFVTFRGDWRNKEHLESGQGAFKPKEIGKKRYGLVDVRFVEKEKQRKDRLSRIRESKYTGQSLFDAYEKLYDSLKSQQSAGRVGQRVVGQRVSKETTYLYMSVEHNQAEFVFEIDSTLQTQIATAIVDCRHCGSQKGKWCVRPQGQKATRSHTSRVEDAGKHGDQILQEFPQLNHTMRWVQRTLRDEKLPYKTIAISELSEGFLTITVKHPGIIDPFNNLYTSLD